MKEEKKVTAEDVERALRFRCAPPQYVFMSSVRDAAGFDARRTADAVAMAVWPSLGLQLVGFEIKVNKWDWRREAKNPAKADGIARYCDKWVIAAPYGVVPHEEMPDAWTLMEMDAKGGMKVTREAKHPLVPIPIDRSFLACILKRALAEARAPGEAEIRAAKEAAFEEGKKSQAYSLEHAQESLARLERQVKEFQEASGIHIDRYGGGKELGRHVSLLQHGGLARIRSLVCSLKQQADEMERTLFESQSPEVRDGAEGVGEKEGRRALGARV